MEPELLDFPPIEAPPLAEKPPATTAVAKAPVASELSLESFDLTKLALAYYGPWESDVAAVKAKLNGLVLDVSTQSKVDEGRSLVHRLVAKPIAAARKTETALKAKLNGTKSDVVAQGAKIVTAYEEAGKAATQQLDEGQAKLDEAKRLKAEAEAARVRAHEAGIAKVRAYLTHCQVPGMTAERIAKGIDLLAAVTFGPEWQEFAEPAKAAQAETLEAMRALHAQTLEREVAAAAAEAQRVENERVAAELAARQAELDAQAAELAEQKRKAEAETARVTGLQAQVAAIHARALNLETKPSWDIFEVIVALENLDVSETAFQEFAPMAADARRLVLAALLKSKDEAEAREAAKATEIATAPDEPARSAGSYYRRQATPAPFATQVDALATATHVVDDGARICPDEPAEVEPGSTQTEAATDATAEDAPPVFIDAALADCRDALREALLLVQDLVNNVPQSSPLAGSTHGILVRVAELRAMGGI